MEACSEQAPWERGECIDPTVAAECCRSSNHASDVAHAELDHPDREESACVSPIARHASKWKSSGSAFPTTAIRIQTYVCASKVCARAHRKVMARPSGEREREHAPGKVSGLLMGGERAEQAEASQPRQAAQARSAQGSSARQQLWQLPSFGLRFGTADQTQEWCEGSGTNERERGRTRRGCRRAGGCRVGATFVCRVEHRVGVRCCLRHYVEAFCCWFYTADPLLVLHGSSASPRMPHYPGACNQSSRVGCKSPCHLPAAPSR